MVGDNVQIAMTGEGIEGNFDCSKIAVDYLMTIKKMDINLTINITNSGLNCCVTDKNGLAQSVITPEQLVAMVYKAQP